MSILLDALRKSEKRERLGTVPGIHSQHSSIDEPEPRRFPGLVALLSATVFLVLAVLTWRQFAPEASYDGSVPGVASELKPEGPGSEAEAEPASGANTSRPAPAPSPGEQAVPVAAGVRTPVESLPEQPRESQPSTQEKARSPNGPRTEHATTSHSAAVPAPPPGPIAQAESDQTKQPQSRPDEDRRTEPISYWQLPNNIREQLPELKITVLVYAEQPADRFILLNGRRQVEGDEIASGLRLAEVQRKGAVFTYRMYRFLVVQ